MGTDLYTATVEKMLEGVTTRIRVSVRPGLGEEPTEGLDVGVGETEQECRGSHG